MKIKLTENITKPITFPCLKKLNDSELVVLFFGSKEGLTVSDKDGIEGEFKNDWKPCDTYIWKDYNGKVFIEIG